MPTRSPSPSDRGTLIETISRAATFRPQQSQQWAEPSRASERRDAALARAEGDARYVVQGVVTARRPLALGAAVLLMVAAAGGGCRRNAASAAPPRPALGMVSVRDVTPEPPASGALDVAG